MKCDYLFLRSLEFNSFPFRIVAKTEFLHIQFIIKKFGANRYILQIQQYQSLLIMNKTKQISKQSSQHRKKKKQTKKKITNEEGDPLIKNLSDFVTSIKIKYSNKPIYTGGRIIQGIKNIYASCNGSIVVYYVESGQIIDRIKHVNQQIANFAVCPTQKYIITFTESASLRVLLLQSKKVLHTVRLYNNFVNDIQFSPDGRYLGLACGNTVNIYTVETMKRTHSYNPTNSKFTITKMLWHPQKLQIITLDMQRNLAVFDYIINKVIGVCADAGTDFCLHNEGNVLIAVNNFQIRFYQYKSLSIRSTLKSTQYIQSLISIDNFLYLGGQQTQLYTINLGVSSYVMKKQEGCTDNGIAKLMCLNKNSNSKRLLVLSIEQNIWVYKISSNGILKHDGIVVGYNDQIIDIRNNKNVRQNQNEKQDIDSQADPNDSGYNGYFVMVTNSNNVKIINKQNHKIQYLVKGHSNTVLCADYWHPFIATAGKDNIAKLWKINHQTHTVQLLANYNGHSADVLSLVALPVSKIIATVSQDNTIKLWAMCTQVQQKVEIKSAIRTAIAHQKSINAVRVSPKQDLLVTCSQDRTLKVWNMHLTNILTLVGHKRGVWDAAFHPVQKLIVSAGGDGMLKGWNLQSGDCMWSIGEGPALIRCAFLYYNQVVTGSLAGIIKIWDIRKQTSLSYDKHQGKIWALDIVRNKQNKIQIMSGATDSTYHIWQDNTLEMKQSIMHEHQLEEQQRIFYDQYLADKNYCQAAIIAFKSNYTKLFMNAIEKMSQNLDAQQPVQLNAEGKLILNDMQDQKMVTEQQFDTMVANLKQIDMSRLLKNIQAMTSTIKLYKMGNRLLLSLLKSTKFIQLIQLNHRYVSLAQQKQQKEDINQFNEKKTDFVKWLQNMIANEQKHISRLEKYIIGTHWIQHKYKVDNPFTA